MFKVNGLDDEETPAKSMIAQVKHNDLNDEQRKKFIVLIVTSLNRFSPNTSKDFAVSWNEGGAKKLLHCTVAFAGNIGEPPQRPNIQWPFPSSKFPSPNGLNFRWTPTPLSSMIRKSLTTRRPPGVKHPTTN